MSTNPKSIYNEFIRANLPVGITYDEVRAQYVTKNGKRFPTYLQAKWYLDYIIKFGYSPVFSVASLFANDEAGAWYDPSDLDTLFQDTAGTTPVTTSGQTVGLMLDKSGNDIDATQPTAAARPTYQTDGTYHWLSFDGVDDFMVTPTITPGAGLSAQFFVGVNVATPKSLNSPIYQYGDATFSSTDAVLKFVTGDGGTDAYRAQVFGSGINQSPRVTAVAPYTSAFSVLYDASAVGSDEISLRENGSVTAVGSATDSGLTSFGNSQMWIGSNQSGSANFFGNIYSLITRFGANLETSTIETTETYVAGKTGVTL